MKTAMRQARERRGWTLDYVAKQIGVSSAQVSRIESDGVRAAETAQAIVKLFGDLTLDEVCSAKQASPEATETVESGV